MFFNCSIFCCFFPQNVVSQIFLKTTLMLQKSIFVLKFFLNHYCLSIYRISFSFPPINCRYPNTTSFTQLHIFQNVVFQVFLKKKKFLFFHYFLLFFLCVQLTFSNFLQFYLAFFSITCCFPNFHVSSNCRYLSSFRNVSCSFRTGFNFFSTLLFSKC